MTYVTHRRAPSTMSGLDYDQARRAAKAGYRIRRSIWVTWLVMGDSGNLSFLLPGKLMKQLGTAYEPTEIDTKATDWVSE